jgi:hypothetical protein
LKTLSVRQPWANLIVHGIKDVENRTRKTNYRGRILIHAPAKDEYKHGIFTKDQLHDIWNRAGNRIRMLRVREKSAIIGSVEIVDCIRDSDSVWAEEDCWHWILKDPILFDKPILNVKGKLSLWEYDL